MGVPSPYKSDQNIMKHMCTEPLTCSEQVGAGPCKTYSFLALKLQRASGLALPHIHRYLSSHCGSRQKIPNRNS